MKVSVTREQALAFVEALAGFHGSEGAVPNSIAARTHLEAALGLDNLISAWDARCCLVSPGRFLDDEAKLRKFTDYLQGVVDALRPEGYGQCRTCVSQPAEGSSCISFGVDMGDRFSCPAYTPKGGDGR